MIDLDRKIIFTHPKKCGGTSIELAFRWLPRRGTNTFERLIGMRNTNTEVYHAKATRFWNQIKHTSLQKKIKIAEQFDPNAVANFFKFVCVRNPWDTAVSLYYFTGCNKYMPFEHFVDAHYAMTIKKNPHRFKKAVMGHAGFLNVAPFVFYGEDFLVDYVIRYETYADDCNFIFKTCGVSWPTRAVHTHTRPKQTKDYKVMYKNDKVIAQVAALGDVNIQLFGYTF